MMNDTDDFYRVTALQLRSALAHVRDGDALKVNAVGNLMVFRDGQWVGWIHMNQDCAFEAVGDATEDTSLIVGERSEDR